MGVHACQPAANAGQKQGKTPVGIFQYGFHRSATADELYQYLSFPGRPRRQLAGDTVQTKIGISKFTLPLNERGLLLIIKNTIFDYQLFINGK
jgi:hypothetical protein